MLHPSISSLTPNNESRYSLVIAISKRARMITEESKEYQVPLREKPVKVAINELNNRKIKIIESDN